jgi:hypothetical protein
MELIVVLSSFSPRLPAAAVDEDARSNTSGSSEGSEIPAQGVTAAAIDRGKYTPESVTIPRSVGTTPKCQKQTKRTVMCDDGLAVPATHGGGGGDNRVDATASLNKKTAEILLENACLERSRLLKAVEVEELKKQTEELKKRCAETELEVANMKKNIFDSCAHTGEILRSFFAPIPRME